ncbi:MAG: phosphoribosylpyrophosphate synthetase [Cytophagales bacterium]|nr:phosphoribosylpyrophosphate synthetase [Cytophagales bacterium]
MDDKQYSYDTLTEAINGLKQRGYTHDFELEFDAIIHRRGQDTPVRYKHDEFEVHEVYRFEGMSSTDDNSVLFAIENKEGHRGLLIDAYGVYAEKLSEDMIRKLKIYY